MPSNIFWLLPVGAVLFGVLLAVRGVRILLADRERRESWLTFPGRVVDSRLVSSGFSDDLTADQTQCQVAYVRDGREVVFWNRFHSTMLRSPKGREVEVLVNPADPNDAVVSRGLASGGAVGGVMTLAGVFFAVVGGGFGVTFMLR